MKSERWKQNVGAGLPAMQAPRCMRYTALMLSPASQRPQGFAAGRQACICPNLPEWKSANA
ncbi:hypothetical protein DXV65_13855 [Pseudomonas fluorescens]|nr:hypothetical protein DXV65_13855 [Pseudomonas fluorescens]